MKSESSLSPRESTQGSFDNLDDKILGSLATALIGDALGAPTEQRSIQEIRTLFGGRVETFLEPPADSPYSKGRKAAQITDDSSQMLMLAQAFIDGNGDVTARAVADMVLTWSENTDYFPHFAGPSTRRAIDALRNGADPEIIGAEGRETTMGTSNGGAMRVAPAGLVYPGDIEGAVHAAAVTCRPSHFTNVGVSGAGAIAAAVAAALRDNASMTDVVRAAREGARLGAAIGGTQGRESAGASVASRMDLAVSIAMTSDDLDTAVSRIADTVGSGLHSAEAVPAALGCFVAAGGDPWWTVVAAANIGDDSDTVATMAGSIAGAYSGFARVPSDKIQQVLAANDLQIGGIAEGLTRIARSRVAQ
ncbi:ADP-ribosylglycohydrolase family protein [Microbacterium sp. PAMC22086]|uniref:ADP-ribosylglycohydrolase family protein n=1 Tax=Microbacterium sp. PAMC22086 TaxID=2861281 RepID=UPI001C630EE9|nr:ADP-ribosylglycohydrolase family protein [Microbacterium sp. PAMC22086]QYG13160.1 ADP-ribosylglycohydrolase family protein [Microbacterium sp. PAMC22086]